MFNADRNRASSYWSASQALGSLLALCLIPLAPSLAQGIERPAAHGLPPLPPRTPRAPRKLSGALATG